MRLTLEALSPENREKLEALGYTLPQYDPNEMRVRTLAAPKWIHLGAGNIFRAFPAVLAQRLLDQGLTDTGILVAESYDPELLDRAYRPFDCLSVSVTLCADGGMRKEITGSVAGVSAMGAEAWPTLQAWFAHPSLQMVSFTITEKGYALRDGQGALLPDVAMDLSAGPDAPRSVMGRITALLLHRFAQNAAPLALVSMDNCSHNGDKLRAALLEVAQAWIEAGSAPADFGGYLAQKVSCPWSMIDKITPRPTEEVADRLKWDGLEGMEPFETAKRTYSAGFVNAEEAQYLVIEDAFPNGCPPLEKAGVYFTARDTVDQVERMKVCTCLNPLHTALAVLGCLLGYSAICDEMADPDLRALAERIGYREGMPVVTDPGILSPRDFLREVLEIRFPNPFLRDAPQRIATDTSQKIPIRFGNTIKAYANADSLDVDSLRCIPFVLAAWLRYLLAVDDEGNPMSCSPDPMLAHCQSVLSGITLGRTDRALVEAALRPLLADTRLWAVDLYEVGLADRVTADFADMTRGPGAVRKALHAVVTA